MTEKNRPSPAQDDWELIEIIERREDFEKILAVSRKAARLNPKLKNDFQAVIERFRLYEILKVERGPGKARLTLANLWRLTRAEGRLTLHSFDLEAGQWREQAPESIIWRESDGISPERNWSETCWPVMAIPYQPAHYKNLLAAWLGKIISRLQGLKIADLPATWWSDAEGFNDYVFRRVRHLPPNEPAQVIDSALRRHIWERELMDLLFTSRFFPPRDDNEVQLSLYLTARANREALARINRETPNLPPLLNLVAPEAWSRPDLWQDRVLRASGPIFSRMSAGALRWLRRAPAPVLDSFRHFLEKAQKEGRLPLEYLPVAAGRLAEVLAGLPPPRADGQPLELLMAAVWNLLRLLINDQPDSLLVTRLARLLARHILALPVITTSGLLARIWPPIHQRGEDFGVQSVIDWFRAVGREQGLPDKNSTWSSLKRRSDQWHREVWQRRGRGIFRNVLGFDVFGADRRMANLEEENAAWESLLGSMEIEGIQIKPLVTGLDLSNEGRAMRHCVVSYARRCLENGCRIFSLTEPDGRRSTLSLSPSPGGFVIDQHKGPDNGPVSPAAARAAREICRLYNLAHQASAEKGPASTGVHQLC